MARDKRAKAMGKKVFRDPWRAERPWDPHEGEGLFEDIREDPGSDDYIWPECGPEDEDEL